MRDPSKGVREVQEAHEVSDAVARLVGVFGWGILGFGMLRDKGLGLHGSANACPIAIVISSQAAKPETQFVPRHANVLILSARLGDRDRLESLSCARDPPL